MDKHQFTTAQLNGGFRAKFVTGEPGPKPFNVLVIKNGIEQQRIAFPTIAEAQAEILKYRPSNSE
jgi:hypothetical protein